MIAPASILIWLSLALVQVTEGPADGGKATVAGTKVPENTTTSGAEKIHWLSFEEAVAQNDVMPKKIFIDVYTDWCGWCKKMDASTFQHPVIKQLMSKYFYAVKLNAETKDTIRFRDQIFTADAKPKAPNTLAVSLLNGKMSYPTTVFMDGAYGILSPVPGFLSADVLEKILVFYGEDHYKSVSWENFQTTFRGQIKMGGE
jgi:thioredoxin-related protein